jgi:death-on-curing protein
VTVFLTVEEVIALHDRESNAGIRDRGILESAVMQPQQTVNGEYAYPTLFEQAARLAFGLNKNQPFVDGNKRAAWLGCTTFLALNGVGLEPIRSTVVADAMDRVADGRMNTVDLALWLARRSS